MACDSSQRLSALVGSSAWAATPEGESSATSAAVESKSKTVVIMVFSLKVERTPLENDPGLGAPRLVNHASHQPLGGGVGWSGSDTAGVEAANVKGDVNRVRAVTGLSEPERNGSWSISTCSYPAARTAATT